MSTETLALALPVAGSGFLLTANCRLHWRRRNELTQYWRALVCIHTRNRLQDGLWRPLEQAHITVTLTWPDRRRRDPANWAPTAKAIVDGLVDGGLLPDDDHRHLTGPDMRGGHGPLAVRITIRPVTPDHSEG
jgi:Holliday junction resolvase RusA-like endonuclease